MRKKLFLFITIVVALCALLAVGVSASEIDYNETATLHDGTVLPIYDENKNSLIWFIVDTEQVDNGDGTTSTKNIYASVPANKNTKENGSSYVTYNINSTYGTNQMHGVYIHYWNEQAQAFVDYNSSGGSSCLVVLNLRSIEQECWSIGSITSKSTEYIYFSADARSCGSYKNNTSLQLVDMSLSTSFTSFGQQAFWGCTSLKEVRLAPGGSYALDCQYSNLFNGCTSLTEITIPDCVTGIGGSAFANCTKLSKVYIGEGSKITYMSNSSFYGCTSLTAFYLPPLLERMGYSTNGTSGTFQNCTSLYFVNEPVTPTYTPEKPSVYYFPANFGKPIVTDNGDGTSTTTSTFTYRAFVNVPLCDTVVLGEYYTTLYDSTFGSSSVKNVVCMGKMTEINYASGKNPTIYLCNSEQASTDGVTLTNSSRYSVVVCNAEGNTTHLESPRARVVIAPTCYSNEYITKYCFCSHKISEGETPDSMIPHEYVDDFDCTTGNQCKQFANCLSELDPEATSHVEAHTVKYDDGFVCAGVHSIFCSNSTCKVLDKTISLGAIFGTSGGYSTNADGAISGGWTVNTENLELYNAYNASPINFGILMIEPSAISDRVLDDNYRIAVQNGREALQIPVTAYDYSNLSFTIDGFSSASAELELIICAYAYVDGEAVQFIQDESSACKVSTLDFEDASLYTVTYSKVVSSRAPSTTPDAILPTDDE